MSKKPVSCADQTPPANLAVLRGAVADFRKLALYPLALLLCCAFTVQAAALPAKQQQNILGLMQLGYYQKAIASLLAQPESATQQVLLGTAYNRTGEYGAAVAALERARQLGSDSAVLARELGWAQLQLGHAEVARVNLAAAVELTPTDEYAQTLLASTETAATGVVAPTAGRSPFDVWFSADAGYGDNVLALSDGQALPPGFSDESSPYIGLYFGARLRPETQDENGFSANYAFASRFYNEFSELNSQQHTLGGQYQMKLSQRLGAAISAGWNTYRIDNDAFRDQASAGVRLVSRWSYAQRSTLAVNYRDNSYKFSPALDRLDRDGDYLGAAFRHQFLAGQTRFYAGLLAGENDARGDDYDYAELGLQGGLHHWFGEIRSGAVTGRPVLGLALGWRALDYDNASVFQPATDRQDSVLDASVQLQIPMVNKFSFFLRYDWRDQDSDVELFDYDQHQYSVGITRLLN